MTMLLLCVVLFSAAWATGQIARDTNWILALFFYIPTPVVFIANTVAAFLFYRRRLLWSALLPIVFAVASLVVVVGLENRWSTPPREEVRKPLRLVHWNVYWGRLGWPAISDQLREESADIVVLNETPNEFASEDLARALGQATIAQGGSIVIAVRGEILNKGWLIEAGDIRIFSADCVIDSTPLKMFAVDIAAPIKNVRDPVLRILVDAMKEHNPDLVVGDFNSPRRSRALDPLPTPYQHAYDAVGGGWSYTWPMPIPVYALDQCIYGARVIAHEYRLKYSLRSDHLRQVFEFGVR
ncbi:MAG: hypothetical protein A3G34_10550 [Candidatus Lindowbacteria bacterium RIFCSPLOWO2_12_FULL_62_27]|nr:MAG: hypothetical protein A3G34_10550 [Candidatus Lindowbacteria bacterium RIFCSPLOWO2_12_FULL_62_27]